MLGEPVSDLGQCRGAGEHHVRIDLDEQVDVIRPLHEGGIKSVVSLPFTKPRELNDLGGGQRLGVKCVQASVSFSFPRGKHTDQKPTLTQDAARSHCCR